MCGHRGDFDRPPDAEAFAGLQSGLEAICPGIKVLANLAGPAEQNADPQLVSELAAGHDLYVNEAFQWSWLPLASVIGPPETLVGVAGLQIAHDLDLIEPYLVDPARPFVVLLGSDRSLLRLRGLDSLVLRADAVLVGGLMSSLVLQAIGKQPAEGTDRDLSRSAGRATG